VLLILRDGEKVLNNKVCAFGSIVTVDRIVIGTDCDIVIKIFVNTERFRFCCQRSNVFICLDGFKVSFEIGIVIDLVDIEFVLISEFFFNYEVGVFCEKVVVRDRIDITGDNLELIKERRIDILSELCEFAFESLFDGKEIIFFIKII
jgi:hypothetical protein